jgi:hypothetical protein
LCLSSASKILNCCAPCAKDVLEKSAHITRAEVTPRLSIRHRTLKMHPLVLPTSRPTHPPSSPPPPRPLQRQRVVRC